MSGLIVPVDVIACCVGVVDAHGPARGLAGATTDFRNQTTDSRPAFLGINVTRNADTAPVWSLESGVHLHWAMPDALTHADTSAGHMKFPALPNRWLVTRVTGAGRAARHWIIRSDAVSASPPDGNPAPTVPVAEPATAAELAAAATGHAAATAGRGFRYLGAREAFAPGWAEPRAVGPALRDLAGSDLHAAATGDVAFAAFYPNSRSSFGFHDDLADLPTGPAELAYVVTGWYATAEADPLHAGLTVAELQARLRWTCARAPEAEQAPGLTLTYSLYSGFTQGISWDPETRYLTDEPEPISGDVAIGNNPAEALAAYFRGTGGHTAPPAVEELLTLYLTGLLPNLATPSAGQLAAVEETLHELQFSGVDGGTIYTIMRGADEVTGLPVPVAAALNVLNGRQQEADLAAVRQRQAKWQLFSWWYRLFEVAEGDQQAALDAVAGALRLAEAAAERVTEAQRAAEDQQQAVQRMLPGGLRLTPVPASRFYTATEPVVLLAGEAASPAARYGGDGRYHPDGYLACRLADGMLRQLSIAAGVTLAAEQFTALAPPSPNQLPYPEIAGLVEEAALLNTAVGAAASGVDEAALAADLVTWLETGTGRHYGQPAGVPPSPVAAGRWTGGNPWLSLSLLWEARFHPLLDVAHRDYPERFFTANYRLDPGNPRRIGYAPTADGIALDPAAIDFDPSQPGSGTIRYSGAAVLSTTAVDNLRARLAADPAAATDPTLRALAGQLDHADIALQALAGFNEALLSRHPGAQLSIGASPAAPLPFIRATRQVAGQITALNQIPSVAPQFHGDYHGVRAGYLTLDLRVLDPFGRKRPVRIGNLYIADSLAARPPLPPFPQSAPVPEPPPVPGVVLAQPRLAQASRLLFRWLAAGTTEYEEMNAHPATTPVCGWLLPDHLNAGFFLYSALGAPLGSLTLRADGSGISWQAAPGEAATAGADLAAVLAHENPHLRDLAFALGGSTLIPSAPGSMTPARFEAFWRAADAALTQIVPAHEASQPGLAALVGRPLALVQASLRLERQGLPALDQTFATLAGDQFTDTDRGTGGVRFPVVLGDLPRLDDGLVGYFRAGASGGYDLSRFFSAAADGDDPGVVMPSPATVLLRPTAAGAARPGAEAETKLLMLTDPRAPVHATTGILPTQSLSIPPDQYADVLGGLELAVPAFPLLRGADGLAVPLPALGGYQWSWITERAAPPGLAVDVDAELAPVPAGALWNYSPQTLTEGWLRLSPQSLRFQLAGPDGTPAVTAGATVSLGLTVTNARAAPVTFTPGSITSEGSPADGSVCYLHFGSLVAPARVAAMRLSAPGWRFGPLNDERHGRYWAATPAQAPVTLAPGAQLTIAMADVTIATAALGPSRVYFDYYNLQGVDDGVDVAILGVRQAAAGIR